VEGEKAEATSNGDAMVRGMLIEVRQSLERNDDAMMKLGQLYDDETRPDLLHKQGQCVSAGKRGGGAFRSVPVALGGPLAP
jgi:hypothetical protein